jgi:hypothetical protein
VSRVERAVRPLALTVTLRAVSAPILLTVPVAVRHWPTSNAAEVAGATGGAAGAVPDAAGGH